MTSPLKTMTAIWMGIETVREARTDDRLILTDDRDLAATMERWLGLSPFVPVERQVA